MDFRVISGNGFVLDLTPVDPWITWAGRSPSVLCKAGQSFPLRVTVKSQEQILLRTVVPSPPTASQSACTLPNLLTETSEPEDPSVAPEDSFFFFLLSARECSTQGVNMVLTPEHWILSSESKPG